MKNAAIAKSILILTVALALSPAISAQSSGKPILKDRLIKVLQQKTFANPTIISIIEKNGVDFVLTSNLETELRALGADDNLIEAVRKNYRGAIKETEANAFSVRRDSLALAFPVKKEKLVQTLQSKELKEAALTAVIKKNGVDFKLTPAIERELRSADASPALIAAVRENYRLLAQGLINGKAVNLVSPSYPPAALSAKAEGSVQVLVVVDEQGSVTEARAVSGHELLWKAAENAALNSKFKPTVLEGQKIKITGIILYTFAAEKSN